MSRQTRRSRKSTGASEDRRSEVRVLVRVSALATSSAPLEEALRGILGAVAEGLGFDRAALHLLDAAGALLEPALVLEEGASVPGAPVEMAGDEPEARAVRDARVVEVGDGDGGPAGVYVPVWAHERVVGVLAAGRRTGPKVAPSQVDALQAVANQVGVLVENRRLHQAHEAKIQQLLALQRLGREMTSTREIDPLLQMVVEEALRLTGAEGSLLYLVEEDGERLGLVAWAGTEPPPGRETVPLGYGIPGWVARAGKPLRVSDRGTGRAQAGYVTRKSQLAVPLRSEGQVVGVLGVEGRREEAFTATHEEILSIFAAQAAKAIEAARLFAQVRQERDLREKILGGTPNGVVALDGRRRVMLANRAARRLLDMEEDPTGNPVERYLAAEPFLERLGRVLAGEAVLESLEVTLGAGRSQRHLMVNIFPLGEPGDRGLTLVLQDLTERRKLDERVQRMDRLASIGQLAAGIAHEIRNPLTGIGISLEILGQEEGLTAPARSLLDDVNREIDRLESLIRGLLDFARPQPVEPRPLRIAKALEWHRTFGGQCRKKGVDFALEMRRNVKLQGDPERLKQLFLNLAINALEVTPPGGRIRIWADGAEEPGEPGQTAVRWARVAVEDTGPGMDEETASQIFNPFFTTKNEGTGLGLSIAHSIVEQHGGRIDVQTSPGAGTRFTVDLPALD